MTKAVTLAELADQNVLTATDNKVGIATTNPQSTLQVGIGITMDGNAGVITAQSFVGDGSGLIGVASTDNIITSTASTFANINSTGIITATSRITVGTAVTANGDGINVIGIVTATSFEGSGANLTNLPASGDSNDITASLFI